MRSSTTSVSRSHVKFLFFLFAAALAVSACGSSDEVDAGADGNSEDADSENGESDTGSEDPASSGDYRVTSAEPEMMSPQAAPIIEIVTIDDQTIGVRYQNGSEPCALANVTVTEGDSEISVLLETGLHPNVAAMSCVAEVVDYEIQVKLAAPVGERTIVPAS